MRNCHIVKLALLLCMELLLASCGGGNNASSSSADQSISSDNLTVSQAQPTAHALSVQPQTSSTYQADQQVIAVFGVSPWDNLSNSPPVPSPQGGYSCLAPIGADLASLSEQCTIDSLSILGPWFRADLGPDSTGSIPPTGKSMPGSAAAAAIVKQIPRCGTPYVLGLHRIISCRIYSVYYQINDIKLLDPVPITGYGTSSLMYGITITTDTAKLATGNRQVLGIAADGVAQVVLKIPATAAGERFTVKIKDGQCATSGSACTDSYGRIVDLTSQTATLYTNTPLDSAQTTPAIGTAFGNFAFIAYRAPSDFARTDGTGQSDSDNASRFVTLQITSQDGVSRELSVQVVRPPVILIHGNWSDPSAWDSFLSPLYSANAARYGYDKSNSFYFERLDYSDTYTKGVGNSIANANTQQASLLSKFRQNTQIAAAQWDVVAYSLGGLLARRMSEQTDVIMTSAYARGPFHKMVTLDTPHLGSPFANALIDPKNSGCKSMIDLVNPVQQNIYDLAQGSYLIKDLSNNNSGAMHINMHAVTGIASASQTRSSEQNLSNLPLGICKSLLPTGGFTSLFKNEKNDLIVSISSMAATGLGIAGTIPTSQPQTPSGMNVNVVHTVNATLIPEGPDVLGHDLNSNAIIDARAGAYNIITRHVIDLLNKPASDKYSFRQVTP